MAVGGGLAFRETTVAKVLRTWLAVGFSFSRQKAHRGKFASRASTVLAVDSDGARAPIMPELAQHAWEDTVAFLNDSALAKRAAATLLWVRAFLRRKQGSVDRAPTADPHNGLGEQVAIKFDARARSQTSALLLLDSRGCRGQQLCEGLAALAGLRLWAHHWQGRRADVAVQSDFVLTLAMAMRCRTKGPAGTAAAARELALRIAEAARGPDAVAHAPGDFYLAADELSQCFCPASPRT
ncbi:unnamed protein product, partial [Prorocentrum cordatum]